MRHRVSLAAVMGSVACCLLVAASVGPSAARGQDDNEKPKAKPVGVVKATIFLGAFE